MPLEAAQDQDVDDQVDTTQDDQTEGDDPGGEDDADAAPTTFAEVASAMGHKPKAQFVPKREGDRWLTAKEFIEANSQRQRNTNRALRDTKSKLDRLEPLVAQLQQRMTGDERAVLRRQAREMMEAGDYDKAEELMEKAAAPASSEPAEHPAITDFKDRNAGWLGVDQEATDYMNAVDRRMVAEAGGNVSDVAGHARKLEAAVKRRFPELFETEAAKDDERPVRKPPLVQRGLRTDRTTPTTITAASLTPKQRRDADSMNVSHKDWAEQLNVINQQTGAAA